LNNFLELLKGETASHNLMDTNLTKIIKMQSHLFVQVAGDASAGFEKRMLSVEILGLLYRSPAHEGCPHILIEKLICIALTMDKLPNAEVFSESLSEKIILLKSLTQLIASIVTTHDMWTEFVSFLLDVATVEAKHKPITLKSEKSLIPSTNPSPQESFLYLARQHSQQDDKANNLTGIKLKKPELQPKPKPTQSIR
jgi:hypothetical protein